MRLRTVRNLGPGVVIPKDPPRRPEALSDLTEAQRCALLLYASSPIPTSTRGTAWRPNPELADTFIRRPVTKATLDALLLADLIHITQTKKGQDVWAPTPEGWKLVSEHVPLLLAASSDAIYTHDPDASMRDEGEGVTREDIDAAWFGRAQERHAEAADRRARAKQARMRRKAA
jgi:hypothetical protein